MKIARISSVDPMIQLISTWPPERSGEEDAEHVDDDRPDEDVRRPVVHLAHEQAAPDGEAQVDRRVEGLRDVLAASGTYGPW